MSRVKPMRPPSQSRAPGQASRSASRLPAAGAGAVAPAAGVSLAKAPRQQAQQQRIAQLRALAPSAPSQAANGLPEPLRAGIESLSGLDLSGVRVHRNSSKPAALQAHAYAQGQDIHLGPGQEQHLPHEAWHVVQQAQGRVKPTVQMKQGVALNTDAALEREADQMGARAAGRPGESRAAQQAGAAAVAANPAAAAMQSKEAQLRSKAAVTLGQDPIASDAPPIQAFGFAAVHLLDEGGPYIANITFHERVPTSASKGKGDHTVAETLITNSIKSLIGTTVEGFLEGLYRLVTDNLQGHESAQHTQAVEEQRATTTVDGLLLAISEGVRDVSAFELAGRLSDLLSMYWRLLEKREATAFDRSEGKTTGGTGGVGEEKARKLLLELDGRLASIEPSTWWALHMEVDATAEVVVGCMDIVVAEFTPDQILYLCHRGARHAATAVGVSNTDWINKVAVKAYARLTGQALGPRRAPENPFL
ncbi:DUF4157 domain-containing protein [Mitsuaria sp. WAJ17]|uniref:eCIS core domain-containing protein n=1 Tax=Mitsuaria sp. WAJ17 TaxID=2761452 RepID=UPI0016045A47|nr:DUF4157 domain-containing protein [Mitsuaria sp. WAJ17]MBB2487445.1 DUF4157 domain-containing protein [Mitsuaria sp. WAJ17]